MENKTLLISGLVIAISIGLLFTYIRYSAKTSNGNCSNCGKNSCDLDCSARKSSPLGGEDLKALVPSCSLSSSEMAERRSFLQSSLAKKITRVEELETGYELIFEGQPKEHSLELLKFINFERGCCSSFSFALVFEPYDKATHLQMYGSKQIKEELAKGFIEAGFLKQ